MMNAPLRALNRFGLGARAGERRTISDPRSWLRVQLQDGAPLVQVPIEATPSAIEEALRAFRMVIQGNRQERQQARRRLVEVASAESRTALAERIGSDRPFVERLVAFWSNHF